MESGELEDLSAPIREPADRDIGGRGELGGHAVVRRCGRRRGMMPGETTEHKSDPAECVALLVESEIPDNPVEKRDGRRLGRTILPGTPEANKRLLHEVLAILPFTHDPLGIPKKRRPVQIHQSLKRAGVAIGEAPAGIVAVRSSDRCRIAVDVLEPNRNHHRAQKEGEESAGFSGPYSEHRSGWGGVKPASIPHGRRNEAREGTGTATAIASTGRNGHVG